MQDPTDPSSEGATGQRAPTEGARCAEHPELPAHAVCARCGNFMCATCSLHGRSSQCNACRGRMGATSFPFSRERFGIGELIGYSYERFKPHWLMLSLCSLVFLAVIYGIAFVGGVAGMLIATVAASDPTQSAIVSGVVQAIMQVVALVAQMWLQLGLFHVTLEALQGRDVQIGAMFAHLRRVPAGLGQLLVIYLGFALVIGPIALGAYMLAGSDTEKAITFALAAGAVALIPLIYVMLGMSFAMVELVYNPASGAISALRTSFALVQGQRWVVLGTAIICGLVVMGGMFACCVGMIPAMALAMMIYSSLFLALRTPAHTA